MGHVKVTDQLQWVRWLTEGFPEYELPPLVLDAACAVAGNYSWENNALPVTLGRLDHGSQGGAQWRLDRLGPDTIPTSLMGWCASHTDSETGQPLDWKTIKAQSAFTIWELRTKYFKLYSDMQYGHKSLATQTANFMEVYEVPAPATANLDARIAFANQIKAAWNAATVPTAPVPEPTPAPEPVPAPPVPYPLPPAPIPTPIPPPPPMPAPSAGRLAAVLDQLNAIHQKYVADRAAADAEDAVLVAAIKELSGIGPSPAVVAKPAPAATTPKQGILPVNSSILGTNWKTTAGGIGALLGAAAAILHDVSSGQMPDTASLGLIFAALSAGWAGLQAKDASTTGGTVAATPEAARRIANQ